MNLIDRYLQEMGRHLPAKMRRDVLEELHSAIGDALDARRKEEPGRDEAVLAREVLRDFGPPDRIARSYVSEGDYLVGPRLYPAFMTALKVLLVGGAVLLGASLIFTLLRLGSFHPSFLIVSMLQIPLMIMPLLGLLTLIFFVVERGSRPRWRSDRGSGGEWNPDSLPAAESDRPVSRAGAVARICIYVLLAAHLGLAPVFSFFMADARTLVSPAEFLAFTHPPLLALAGLWLLAALVFQFILLRRKRWESWSLWTDILMHGVAFLALARMVLLSPHLHFAAPWFFHTEHTLGLGFPQAAPPMLAFLLSRSLFAVLALLCLVQAIRQIRRLRTAPPGSSLVRAA